MNRKQKQRGNNLDRGYHGDRDNHGHSEKYTPVLPEAANMEGVRYSSPEPVSWYGNQVAPASAEAVQRAQLHQGSPSQHDNTRVQRSTAGQWANKKEDFIIGGKLLS